MSCKAKTSKPSVSVLTGHPKSGTTLLLALLDSHPELLVFPEEAWYFAKAYARNKTIRKQRLFSETGIRHIISRGVKDLGGRRDYSDPKFEEFKTILENEFEKSESTKKEVLSVITSWQKILGTNGRQKRWIEKGPANEFYTYQYQRIFKDAIFIHCFRDPRDIWAAYKKKWPQLGIGDFALRWALSTKIANYLNKKNHSFHTLRYESLVSHPETLMRSVAHIYGVNYHPILLRPTRVGIPWTGNSMHGRRFNGISQSSKGKYQEFLKKEEIILLEGLLSALMREAGYKMDCMHLHERDLVLSFQRTLTIKFVVWLLFMKGFSGHPYAIALWRRAHGMNLRFKVKKY